MLSVGTRRAAPLLGLLVLTLWGCGAAERVEISQARKVTDPADPAGADMDLRFHGETGHDHGGSGETTPSSSGPSELPFDWVTPEGWTTAPSTSMRVINFVVGAGAECYLTVLPGSAGGINANVNRWRGQFSLEQQSAAEIAAMPQIPLLGQPAMLIELEGDYKGMGDSAAKDWALRGAIQEAGRFTAFVKMTGPREVVAAQASNFDLFCTSLVPIASGTGSSSASTEAPSNVPSGDGLPPAKGRAGDFAYDVPEGWTDAGAKSMRAINLAFGTVGQCYLIELTGDAGGLLPNLNRWRGEVGMEPLTEAGIAQLERVPMLGTEVPLFEGSGTYQGMGGPGGGDMQVFGVALIRDTTSLFIKLVAPVTEAEPERAKFLALLASLEEL
ncbi:MAG: hypothetical protein P1V81_13215 [Planctomycetota bacterium]|nr:hypothetical protein [Planctomycetota bacterium]